MKSEKINWSTKFWVICLLVFWSPLIVFGIFIFIGHGFEPLIATLHLREMNTIEYPLEIGDVWSEEHFDFVIENVIELDISDSKAVELLEKPSNTTVDTAKVYLVTFHFEDKVHRIGDYDVYTCAYESDREMIGCPLPDNRVNPFSNREGELVFLSPVGTDYIDIVVRIPFTENRYYKNIYRFYVEDVEDNACSE